MTVEELRRMGEGELMVWVGTASLKDLKWAQAYALSSLALAAMQARIAHLEDSRRSWRILVVGVLTLLAAVGAVIVGVTALVMHR
jgi:hypothetical protein